MKEGKNNKEKEFAEMPSTVEMDLPVLYFIEDGVYFASLPALDITGYGNTEKEAAKSLNIMLEEFFAYAAENNTLEIELKKLGWKKAPPALMTSLKHSAHLQNIVNTTPFKTDKFHLQVPAHN